MFRAALLIQHADEAGAQGTRPGHQRRCRRHETVESDLGLSPDRSTDRLGLRHLAQQGRRALRGLGRHTDAGRITATRAPAGDVYSAIGNSPPTAYWLPVDP